MFNLKIDSLKFGIYQCDPDWIVNEKGSIFHRLYYVYEGIAVFKDDVQYFTLERGHLYLFPVNKPYTITHDVSAPFKCLFFHVTTYPLILNRIIDINTSRMSEIYHIIKVLESITEDKSTYDVSFINKMVESLLILIGKRSEFLLLSHESLQKVLEYMHDNYALKVTNTELSTIAGFDCSYFVRLFHKTLGDTPQSYISKYRLSKAANLILEDMPLKKVSQSIGFDDAKAFSRAFKKYKGFSPGEYKKSHFLQL